MLTASTFYFISPSTNFKWATKLIDIRHLSAGRGAMARVCSLANVAACNAVHDFKIAPLNLGTLFRCFVLAGALHP